MFLFQDERETECGREKATLGGHLHDRWDFSFSCSVEEEKEGFFLLPFLWKEKSRVESLPLCKPWDELT